MFLFFFSCDHLFHWINLSLREHMIEVGLKCVRNALVPEHDAGEEKKRRRTGQDHPTDEEQHEIGRIASTTRRMRLNEYDCSRSFSMHAWLFASGTNCRNLTRVREEMTTYSEVRMPKFYYNVFEC